jgi:diguanylate cyclase
MPRSIRLSLPDCFCCAARCLRAGLLVPLLALLALLSSLPLAASAQPTSLLLDGRAKVYDAWPAVTTLSDPAKDLSPEQVMALTDRFAVPRTAHATLGLRKDAVWLRIPVELAAGAERFWILDIDYPVLHRIDVFVVRDGRILRRALLGEVIPVADRPLASRSHAVTLDLQPGARQEIFLRVETNGTMILPISLNRPAAFAERALAEQMLQGLLTGLALCLLIYSIGQYLSLRETLFIKYALLISGSLLFSLLHFGVGAQFVWTDNAWVATHIGGLSAMIASCGSFLFIEHALAGPDMHRWFSRVMKGGAVLSAIVGVIYATGVMDIEVITAIVSVLGLMPALMGMSGAIKRARQGDSVGTYFLIAWTIYFVATAVVIGIIKGQIGVNFWTNHAFQFGATLDMLVFMRVLGLRTQAIQAAAKHAALERDAMHSLAHADALTGLPNRRGLNSKLMAALPSASAERLLAIYVLDLDGFKPVNDQHGHDVGDELLIAVAWRLQSHMRASDVVARLGGDEFVVMAAGLHNDQQAQDLGTTLLDAFRKPFALTRHTCSVGLTIGYVLAPLDGNEPMSLLKRADAAMYVGKQSGKHCLRRGTAR